MPVPIHHSPPIAMNPLPHSLFACLAATPILAVMLSDRALAQESIVIRELVNTGQEVDFTFTSSMRPGTAYQPQFNPSFQGTWVDMPDARVVPVDGMPGTYRVTAPMFGGAGGFFRVVAAGAATGAPIASTLDTEPKPREDQVLVLWNDRSSGPGPVTGKLYGFADASPDGGVPASFQPLPRAEFGGDTGQGASSAQDVLVVDLTGDGIPNPVMAWAGADGRVRLVVPQLDGDGSPWGPGVTHVVPGPPLDLAATNPPAIIRLVAAQLDDDSPPEAALAYSTEDGRVHLVTIDFNGDPAAAPTIGAANTSIALPAGGTLRRSARFDLAAGNFDGDADGTDKLAVVCARPVTIPNGLDNWQLHVVYFRVTASALAPVAELPPDATSLYIKDGRATVWLDRLAAVAADFDGDGADELAVGFATTDNSSRGLWYLQLVGTNPGLTSAQIVPPTPTAHHQTNGDTGHPLTLLALPLDDDAPLELMYAGRQVHFFDIQAGLVAVDAGTATLPVVRSSESRRHAVLADLVPPAGAGERDWPEVVSIQEVVVPGNGSPNQAVLEISAHRIVETGPGQFTLQEMVRTRDEASPSNSLNRTFALVTAPFAPLDLKLGVPRRSTRIVSQRPTVILNAPPVHFDVLDGVAFDVCRMFPTADCALDPDSGELVCPFMARFSRTAASSVSVETQWQRSWEVSTTVGGGFNLPLTKVQVEAQITTRFGEAFEDFASTTESTVVEVQIDAIDDDRLYATTLNYDVWEYPVLLNGTDVIGHIVLIVPSVVRQNWFSSKSVVAQDYRPFHEVGNLLSYRRIPEPYPGFELVRPIVSDTFTVAATGGSSVWRLTKSIGATTSQSKTFNFSLSTEASFDIPVPFIPNIEVTGDYSSSSLRAATTTVADTNGLACTFGPLDGTIAGTTYSITPFLYWHRSGALVLDYAVDLPLGTPNLPTFWNQQYTGKPDPTFILPWRHDPEKGLAIVGDQRRLTRDISTLPLDPRPGQRVTVQVRVSNFSLTPVAAPIAVRIHLGDPALGGPLIHQTAIPAGLAAQAKHLVEFPYTIPADITTASLTFYAVLDPANAIDEIHEDNNIAWGEVFLRRGP